MGPFRSCPDPTDSTRIPTRQPALGTALKPFLILDPDELPSFIH
jgi:hypothetical protein